MLAFWFSSAILRGKNHLLDSHDINDLRSVCLWGTSSSSLRWHIHKDTNSPCMSREAPRRMLQERTGPPRNREISRRPHSFGGPFRLIPEVYITILGTELTENLGDLWFGPFGTPWAGPPGRTECGIHPKTLGIIHAQTIKSLLTHGNIWRHVC